MTVGLEEEQFFIALQRNPNDVNALDALGMLAARTGRLDAALSALRRAASLAPEDAAVQTHFAHVLHDRGDWEAARLQYARALALAPDDQLAHEGACYTAMRLDDYESAQAHREQAFRGRIVTSYIGAQGSATILLLVSAFGGNVDTRPFVVEANRNVVKVVAEYLDQVESIPPYDIVFNAVGDADRCAAALAKIATRFAGETRRVCNQPARVAATTRIANARRFAEISGVRTALTVTYSRAALLENTGLIHADGFTYPLLVRAPGYHTGQHFVRVNEAEHLAGALKTLPSDDVLVIELLDLRDDDGLFRKYRMMTIGGKLYPVHLAISDQWKVHYLTSLMDLRSDLRAEEAAFLCAPDVAIGGNAMRSLELLAQSLALDYGGIDFGIDAEGRVVVFEANATMIIANPKSDGKYFYRRAALRTAQDAATELFAV